MDTTISISTDVREQIKEFGMKGDTYNDILSRLIKKTKERQLQDLLMDDSDSIPIDQAIKDAKKKWPR